MRLAEALSRIGESELRRIAVEVDPPALESGAGFLVGRLERTLASPAHVELAVMRRRPPVFGLLEALLESDGELTLDECRETSERVTREIEQRVDAGDLATGPGRDLYRRVLTEAWRSDLTIDPSEASILGVLRHELKIRRVEHFLIAHHREVRPFWSTEDGFGTVVDALRRAGILFHIGSDLVIAEEARPFLRRSIGLPLDSRHSRRLFVHLSGGDLRDALKSMDLRSSGSKDERVARLVDHFCSPTDVLDVVHIHRIKDLASKLGCKKAGSKEEVMERIVQWVADEADLKVPATEDPPPTEPRALPEAGFVELLYQLKNGEIGAILWKHRDELRQTGSKQKKIEVLASSRFSETTLLSKLDNRALSEVLERLGLDRSGSKQEMVDRLLSAGWTGESTHSDGEEGKASESAESPSPPLNRDDMDSGRGAGGDTASPN